MKWEIYQNYFYKWIGYGKEKYYIKMQNVYAFSDTIARVFVWTC